MKESKRISPAMKKEDLKIVFFGTPEFAVASLDRIVKDGYNVVAAVTMPDKPAGRGHKMFQSPVKEYAIANGIPLMQPAKLKDEDFINELRGYNADLFIVIAFRMLPEVVWQMPPLGTFNLHASLLPRYRGAAPINWAVINGDTETGVTTFFLKHEIDTGDILRQERIDILPEDNVGDVHDKLMTLGADLTVDTISHIIAGDLTPMSQDAILKGEESTPAPNIFCDIGFSFFCSTSACAFLNSSIRFNSSSASSNPICVYTFIVTDISECPMRYCNVLGFIPDFAIFEQYVCRHTCGVMFGICTR